MYTGRQSKQFDNNIYLGIKGMKSPTKEKVERM